MPIGQTSGTLVELAHRASRVGIWSFAAQLVEAPAVPVTVIAELLREAAGIKVRAPRTLLVDHAVVRELGT